jgi:hypothetical protein
MFKNFNTEFAVTTGVKSASLSEELNQGYVGYIMRKTTYKLKFDAN